MKGQVVVRLKHEVLDPQGVTIAKALANLGYDTVADLRQGKVFDIELQTEDPEEARRQLEAMARELLANPVIETFEVTVAATATTTAATNTTAATDTPAATDTTDDGAPS